MLHMHNECLCIILNNKHDKMDADEKIVMIYMTITCFRALCQRQDIIKNRVRQPGYDVTLKALIYISINQDTKGFFQFEIIINVSVSSFRFI